MQAGFAREKITPLGRKIGIAGDIPIRVTDDVFTDLWATCMVLEDACTRVIWVSLDMCHVTKTLYRDVVKTLTEHVPGFSRKQLVLNATHATALAYVSEEFFETRDEALSEPLTPLKEIRELICSGVLRAVQRAITQRERVKIALAYADIVTGLCRRVVYQDQSAVMYGKTHRDDFQKMEYPDGRETQLVYFYSDLDGRILGVLCAVPCPAQADEGAVHITADYWDTVRRKLADAYGDEMCVVPCCRFAGELSPRKVFDPFVKYPKYRSGAAYAAALGSRIANAVIAEEGSPIKTYGADELSLSADMFDLDYPVRMPTAEEVEKAHGFMQAYQDFNAREKHASRFAKCECFQAIKLESLKQTRYLAPVSLLKIADIVIYTAPAEMFSEYAQQMASRFGHLCMIDVQLANDYLGYMPTREAAAHGGYSTGLLSCMTDLKGTEAYMQTMMELISNLE